jgi:ATP-dependent DNA helicase RecG
MYPEIAIRELVANAIIHQDLEEKGTGPVVEIYSDRIEISNPGLPLITPNRFIDEYQSRNEDLAGIMRRFRICEERGSGIDKVIFNIELYQLPALDVHIQEKHTKVLLFAYKKFADMDKKDRIRACYQHACLKYVTNSTMTNTSLRDRFKIAEGNAAMVSRIIKDTYEAGLIKEENPENTSRKFVKYIPIWA